MSVAPEMHLVVRVPGQEAHGQRAAGEQRAPGVERERRASLPEADAHEAVMQVVGVGRPERAAVLDAVQQHERRVEDRHQQHERREQQRHGGRGLEHALDRDQRQQVAERERAGVAHEHARRMEVVAQEAEARARQRGGEQRRAAAVEREREDRERGGRDRPDAGRQPVHAVDEVEAVHQRDDPEHRHRVLQHSQVERVQQRQRQVVDRRAGGDRDGCCHELAGELRDRVDLEAVVEQADRRADAGADQDRVRAPAQRRLQQQHRDRHGGEHRDPAAEGDRPVCRRRSELRRSSSPTRAAIRAASGVSQSASAQARLNATTASRRAWVTGAPSA